MTRPAPTPAARIASLTCLGEIDGYTRQLEAEGRLTTDERQALATRAAEIQRERMRK